MLAWFAALMTAAGLFLAALAAYVGWRRGTRAGLALGVLLLSVAWWGLAYAVELSASDVATKSLWGDLKYFGVCTLAPAWLVFVLQYTGRARQVTRRMLAVLALVPVGVLVTLFVPATHALVRSYPADAAGETVQDVSAGPVFWLHLVYANAVILVATALFVTTMVRLSRTYRFMAARAGGRRPAALGGQPALQLRRRLVLPPGPDTVRLHRHGCRPGVGPVP